MARYLGIDLGTTKIAAVVVESDSGQIVGSAESPNSARRGSSAGRSEWDAETMVALAVSAAHRALDTAPGARVVAGVGVTGQMHGMLLVDASLRPATPFVGWQDKRGDEPTASAPTLVDEMIARAGADAFAASGCRIATGFAGSTLYWLAANGALPREASTMAFIPDYLVARLTGGQPVTDPTNAGGSGLFDVVNRRWDRDLVAALGLPAGILPEIRRTGEIVGTLTADAAVLLGLPAGVPVVNALGDNQASVLGSVADPANDLLINVGTGAQVSAVSESFAPAGELETRAFVGSTNLIAGNELAGGSAYAALRDFVRLVGEECFGLTNLAADSSAIYERLNALAAAVPAGAGGLRCDTRIAGTRAEPERRGGFSGLAADLFTPGHFARAVLEGLADRFHALYEQMLAAGLSPRRRLVGSGNGIRRNPLLARVVAERFGLPLVTPRDVEEAAFGAALLAAVGTGELGSTAEIGRRIRY